MHERMDDGPDHRSQCVRRTSFRNDAREDQVQELDSPNPRCPYKPRGRVHFRAPDRKNRGPPNSLVFSHRKLGIFISRQGLPKESGIRRGLGVFGDALLYNGSNRVVVNVDTLQKLVSGLSTSVLQPSFCANRVPCAEHAFVDFLGQTNTSVVPHRPDP